MKLNSMKKSKKIKLKLLVIFVLTLSIVLISLSLIFNYTAGKAIKELAEYAYGIDQENNQIISRELFYDLTVETANDWSEYFRTTGKLVEMLANNVLTQLKATKNININHDTGINLKKYKGRDFLVDTSQKQFSIYYWGNENYLPLRIEKQLISLKNIGDTFIGIRNIHPHFFYDVYVISTDNYAFIYPQVESYYKNVMNRSDFNYSFNSFPLSRDDLNNEVLLPCIFERPYRDKAGRVTMAVKTGIYIKGKLVAHVGIELNVEKFRNSMISNRLYVTQNDDKANGKRQNFLFLLDKNGNIITFPKQYADLFSLPKDYLNLKHYLDKNSVKLSSSKNPLIEALGEKIVKGSKGIEEIVIDNDVYTIAYCTVNKNSWTLGNVIRKNDLLSSTVKSEKLINATVDKLFGQYSMITLIFLVLSFLILYFLFRYYILRPLRRIRSGIKKMGNGDFNINLKEESAEEIAELSSAFNYLGKELRDYMSNLKIEISNRQAIETEIQLAEKIQLSVLPNAYNFPSKGFFEIRTRLNPAKSISGDFYDFFYVSKDKIAILVADVSGKGLPAAFFMAISKVLIKKQCLLEPDDPAKVLEQVNKTLCMDNKSQMFVTVSLSFYNIKNGTIDYANAGHHKCITIRGNNVLEPGGGKNMALGILEETEITNEREVLEIGDLIILYTDGVSEALSPEGKEYGTERLKKLVIKNKNLSLDNICDVIIKDVTGFEAENRFDDITLVAFKKLK